MKNDIDDSPAPPCRNPLLPLAGLALALLAVVLAFPTIRQALPENARSRPRVREFMIFDTYARLTFWAPKRRADAAMDEMQGELRELHRTINVFDPESELAQLNAVAHLGPVACSDRLWGVVDASREAYVASEGAFDVTVGPLMKLWGFHGKRRELPAAEDVAAARRLVGLDKVVFDAARQTVQFEREGMFMDFGGIAKGYALDICRAIADEHGLRRGILDLGGDIICLDKPPPGKTHYSIGIRHPLQTDQILDVAEMRGMAIATSGNYERNFMLDGQFIHHIVDPLTGWPAPTMASVTVIAAQGLLADVFATAIFVRGEKLVDNLLARSPEARVATISTRPESPDEITLETYNWP